MLRRRAGARDERDDERPNDGGTGLVRTGKHLVRAAKKGVEQMHQIYEKAVWMVARQAERGHDDEVELIDPSWTLGDLREATALINALTEGIGEVHLGPITRL